MTIIEGPQKVNKFGENKHSLSFDKILSNLPTQGGYSGFQVTGMIEWSQKSKPKKIPGPKINPQKIPCRFCGP